MRRIIPRVAAVHDLSGFGRCSLTVIIPVLSTMGIQACPLPTAVLSTHSGGFGKFAFHDLTGCMEEYADHWKSVGLSFDCLYSGFLASARQIDIVAGFFDSFRSESALAVVDPVMGDYGRLYKTYTAEMQEKMKLLVRKADIITPNFTEACFLTGEPFSDEPVDTGRMKTFLEKLSLMGPETVVITGVAAEGGRYSNIGCSRKCGVCWKVSYDCMPVRYPGTGDIFTSVLIGSLLTGDSLPIAMDRATQFVTMAVRVTYGHNTEEREGVMLEKVLPWLRNELLQSTYEIV